MIIAIFLLYFIYSLFKRASIQRQFICGIALILYSCYSAYDLYWLFNYFDWPFHPSDPSAYYLSVIGKSFNEIWSIESSNTFYYLINWLNWKVWDSPLLVSILLRCDNILAFILTYLLATYKKREINYIDLLLLFNPFVFVTLVRNVRDIYILLFVIITLIGIGIFPLYKSNKFLTLVGVLLLLITRAVMLMPILIAAIFYYHDRILKINKYIIISIIILLIINFYPFILGLIANQMISAIDYMGEDIEPYAPLLKGQLSISIIKIVLQRLFIGLISFLFTPHPLNFYRNWQAVQDYDAIVGIYTFPDNFLIFIGSIFNYLFIVPLIIFLIYNYKKVNHELLIFILLFIIIYVVSFLGVVDIRNRNTAIFFILLTLYYSKNKIILTVKHYILTVGIFVGLYLISAK